MWGSRAAPPYLEPRSVVMATGGRKIVAAVDDSEASAYAFTWGLHNLVRQGDHVVVLTVASFAESSDLSTMDLVGELAVPLSPSVAESEAAQKVITEKSKSLVAKYLAQCSAANISCDGEVVKGDPASWIVDEANRLKADMVVVGSHAYGIIKRAILGSISDSVLHNAKCPVVIVRQSEALEAHDPLSSSGMPKKVVIAVDESKESVHAFSWALDHFCNPSDKVIIYHVHHPAATPVTALGTGEFGVEDVYLPPGNDVREEVKALNESENLVQRYMEHVPQDKKISCEGMVVTGPTEAKVCEGLVALKADAVVIGTQDRSAFSRTFLGSVTDYLAHNSPCPLVVVKTVKPNPETEAVKAGHIHAS